MIKSQKQLEREAYKASFFKTKPIKESSVGTPDAMRPPEETKIHPPTGGKTKNERNGKTGSVTFIDCDSAEVGRIEWTKGKIMTEGDQTIQAGCDGGTSSSS